MEDNSDTKAILTTIIVPVYNVSPYLESCLNSLLSQTFTNWEAICIDDGSTDGSGLILDSYAIKDKRFHVIHQPNQGVSVARNEGLKRALGAYVIMVDPDDWIEPNMLENMVEMMEITSADLGICGWTYEREDGKGKSVILGNIFSFPGKKYGSAELNPSHRKHLGSNVWNKIFKTKIINLLDLSFSPGVKTGEDLEFVIRYISHCIKISYFYHPLYHYREGTGVTNSILLGNMSEKDLLLCMNAWESLMTCKAGQHLNRRQKKGFYTILLQSVLSWRELRQWVSFSTHTKKSLSFPYTWSLRLLFQGSFFHGLIIILKIQFPKVAKWIKKGYDSLKLRNG